MTTPELLRTDIPVAGVPWPAHKLLALAAGLLTVALVAAVTGTAAPAVLSGAAVAATAWVVLAAVRGAPRQGSSTTRS